MGVVVTGSRLTTIRQVFLADHVTVTKGSWVEGVEPALERQMNSESFVELEHERSWHRSEPVLNTLNRHRPHLSVTEQSQHCKNPAVGVRRRRQVELLEHSGAHRLHRPLAHTQP